MGKEKVRLDAGLASLDHYKIRLPQWRYYIRQFLLPIVRWETPYVAYLQQRMRNPVLDQYFAMTANLGTHTAFMVVLPIMFWCGYMSTARGMLHVLAAGVYLSGFVKDLLCLPRPLSPPLTRITMSGSAALEYGFPSTHSTNAVSVVYYALYVLKHPETTISPQNSLIIEAALYIYVTSIVLGRLYCGMHGFFDVIVGSALGAAIGAVQSQWGDFLDAWIYNSPIKGLVFVIIALLAMVRIHPEPADDCPCFDDSVAFAATTIGCEIASWHLVRTPPTWSLPPTASFGIAEIGWPVAILRIILGVVVIFTWRASMKPFLLKMLPPIFRIIESLGMDSPRRFFVRASQYKHVPKQRDDDNVIPSASNIPKFLSDLRQRKRAISIGPQSEADAYETLAYREKQRQDSITSPGSRTPMGEKDGQNGYFGARASTSTKTEGSKGRRRAQSIEEFRRQMGTSAGTEALSPDALLTPGSALQFPAATTSEQQSVQQARLFAQVQKPRVRYDVEVVTKLIIYTGIGWLAIEGNLIMFYFIGWGP